MEEEAKCEKEREGWRERRRVKVIKSPSKLRLVLHHVADQRSTRTLTHSHHQHIPHKTFVLCRFKRKCLTWPRNSFFREKTVQLILKNFYQIIAKEKVQQHITN